MKEKEYFYSVINTVFKDYEYNVRGQFPAFLAFLQGHTDTKANLKKLLYLAQNSFNYVRFFSSLCGIKNVL